MEKKDVIKCLTDILDNYQLDIELITADRQSGEIKTNMKLTHFKHQFDYGITKMLWKNPQKTKTKVTTSKGLDVI